MPTPANQRIESLRDQLLTAQAQLTHDKSFALAIVVTGMPTAGRSEVVNQFLEWLDAKHIKVHALNAWQRGESCVPAMKRYWLTLPARGEIAIFFTGWYEDYLAPALHSTKKAQAADTRVIERIRQFESMLHADRVRVLKMDLRVDRKTQQERIAALRAEKATRWRVTKEDKWLAKHHGQVRKTMDRLIKGTDTPAAPWHVVDGTDPQRRIVAAASLVLKELDSGIRGEIRAAAKRAPRTGQTSKAEVLPTAGPKPNDATYEHELEALQGRLALLSRKGAFGKRCVVLAFEGLDAAGKGGTIRRMTMALDARQYTIVPVSAPTPEEIARPYLWRFWRNLPEPGEFAIFDRSWYGRVLVERVRDLAEGPDWQRAYGEINEFELQLAEAKIIVRKFWLSVGKDEQLKRLNDREEEQLKRFKVDQEDWANRRFFDAYQSAASEMIARTNTAYAPWTVVEADNKKYARLKVLTTVCDALEDALTKSS
jgi:polyphosphate:AMP phosphotransferase